MIRVAVVGTGGIAGYCHVPALRAQAHRTEIVAAVDVDADRVKAFCAEHDIPAAYTDVAAMLEAERPDLVHVCTPPFTHAAVVRACLAAGAWVWCEKPLCLSLAEYDSIEAAAGAAGPYVSVVFQHRFGSGAGHLRELMDGGRLGRPLVAACHTTWYRGHEYFEVPWRGRWETEGGGPTMGHGIHQMDLMLSVLGEWDEIRAMAGTLDRRIETEDVSMAMVRFRNGAMGSVVNSLLSPREESYLRFDFADATVELRHLYGYRNADWTCAPPDAWAPPDDVPSSHDAQLAELLDCYERGERPPVSGAQSRLTMEFVTGLYASAFTGRPVTPADLTPDNPFYQHLNGGKSL
jgi:predicted dehydrogenase